MAEIINDYSKNIGSNVKKVAVSVFERRSNIVYDLILKKSCGPLPKIPDLFMLKY